MMVPHQSIQFYSVSVSVKINVDCFLSVTISLRNTTEGTTDVHPGRAEQENEWYLTLKHQCNTLHIVNVSVNLSVYCVNCVICHKALKMYSNAIFIPS